MKKYLENTIVITKKVRVPKGDTCDYCSFKKHESPLYVDGNGCPVGGGIWCALYGEQLELSNIFRENSIMCATTLPDNWTYKKCKGCLENTNGEHI